MGRRFNIGIKHNFGPAKAIKWVTQVLLKKYDGDERIENQSYGVWKKR